MQNFTSLPPEQEAAFIVYEQRTVEASKKAFTAGMIAGGVFFLLIVAIVFSHSKPKNKMEGEDMGMLADEKERAAERSQLKDSPAPAPTPEGGTPAPAPAPTEGGSAPAPATP